MGLYWDDTLVRQKVGSRDRARITRVTSKIYYRVGHIARMIRMAFVVCTVRSPWLRDKATESRFNFCATFLGTRALTQSNNSLSVSKIANVIVKVKSHGNSMSLRACVVAAAMLFPLNPGDSLSVKDIAKEKHWLLASLKRPEFPEAN